MRPYLQLKLGNVEAARGRAVICIENQESMHSRYVQKLVDIDGTALKEDIYKEILKGRLVLMDIFEPFYVRVSDLEPNLDYPALIGFAQNELRDVIWEKTDSVEKAVLPESLLEQIVARYTTIYRENVYLRVTRQLGDELFHLRKRVAVQRQYDAILHVAYLIHSFTRARREAISLDPEEILSFQSEIPFVDLKKIAQALTRGDASEWYEMAHYVDTFFLTLKKHYPLPLGNGNCLETGKECLVWLSEGLPALLEEYFLALLREEYEKAIEWKLLIEEHHTSQSLEGCSNL
jgi:hypothetical protein